MKKRIDKILGWLEDNTRKLSREELLGNRGFEAGQMAECLGILRNNVSKELNELFRQDKIIKLKGRPVKYLDKAGVEKTLAIQFPQRCLEVADLQALLAKPAEEDPFQYLIGAEKSLRNQVEQAKAAILYPPGGLHTLIVGQTGVGKTLFAKIMYNYGLHIKRFGDGAPFVTFNCADYYNNPQLLLAHVFGFIKGAFTGADQEKPGLVEQANGGILFLDEIHRLPPEGQEMIFYFMDTGTYNKLGETERKRKANVLILGATTEEPDSCFLQTFIRRIPIIIRIPCLQERSIEEQIDVIRYLFANEAHRLHQSIRISAEVVKALIGSVSYGNIGQLKSNIQLICAKGFLDSRSSGKDLIDLDFKALSSSIREGWFELAKNRPQFAEISSVLDTHLLVNPEGHRMYIADSGESSFNLYKLIEDKIGLLQEEGVDEEYINHIKDHSFLRKAPTRNETGQYQSL